MLSVPDMVEEGQPMRTTMTMKTTMTTSLCRSWKLVEGSRWRQIGFVSGMGLGDLEKVVPVVRVMIVWLQECEEGINVVFFPLDERELELLIPGFWLLQRRFLP